MFPNDKLENWYKGKGHWNDIPDHEWYDWKWQMRNCLKSKDDSLISWILPKMSLLDLI